MFGIIPTRVGTSDCKSRTCDRVRDHPHACGDKKKKLKNVKKVGSSPRVWGQAMSSFSALPKNGDHPHACGDKGSAGLSGALCLGSSPRVWGQVCECVKHSDNIRIIPTRVGTSGGSVLSDSITQDHPHACGDKRATPSMCERSKGSSPRVWGQVH